MSHIKYQGVIQLSDKNNAHTLAYDYIAELADGQLLTVLEVGCSTAYFGSALKTFGHTVWGIEPTPEPAQIAKSQLDFVFEGLIEDFIVAHPDQKFDVIVFGDVLEHLPDPESVLLQCHALLKEGGAIVASVPNVTHLAIRAMLMEGRWDYAELGIMDKTHLRFFTRETIQNLFYQAGYVVYDIKPVRIPTDAVAHMSKMPLYASTVAQLDKVVQDDTKLDFQYVMMAFPKSHAKGLSASLLRQQPSIQVLGLANDIASSHAQVRLMNPLEAWARLGQGSVRFSNFANCTQQAVQTADVVVIQRHINDTVFEIMSWAQAAGTKVIYESDDFLLGLPEHLAHHRASLEGFDKKMDALLPQVDCVTVTTHRLAEHQFKSFERPIAIIPNCCIGEQLASVDQTGWQTNHATLIVASSDKVLVDFILSPIKQLLADSSLALKVVVIGPPGETFEAAGVPCERIDNQSYEDFKQLIRRFDNPLALIPLDDSTFSSCKTAIKFFDYAMAGIPVVCSNVPPYSDVITHQRHAWLTSNSAEGWVEGMRTLINSISLRQSLVNDAQSLVNNQFNENTAVRGWDILLKDLVRDRYAFNPPKYPKPEPKKPLTSTLIKNIFNPSAYLFVYRAVKLHGIRFITKKFFD